MKDFLVTECAFVMLPLVKKSTDCVEESIAVSARRDKLRSVRTPPVVNFDCP